MVCQICGKELSAESKFCTGCGSPVSAPAGTPVNNASQGMNFDFSDNTATEASTAKYEYKVLSQKDKWFSGKFDPALLEQAMNAYAKQGWRVIACATADIAGFGAVRQEFVTVMERECK